MSNRIIRAACIVAGLIMVLALVICIVSFAFVYLIGHSHPRVLTATPSQGGGTNLQASQKTTEPPPVPRLNLPAVIVDSQNYGTENNWLAHHIGFRIASLSYLALHPGSITPGNLSVKAQVNAEQRTVDLTISGFSTSPITAKLNPEFIWDPDGYTSLAEQLLGNARESPGTTPSASEGLLAEMLNLTGPELAKADMRLSAQMQSTPLVPTLHEQAALILVGLALRDRAANFTDYRQILCRATAHLAMAKALRRGQELDWSGEIADAGLRLLAGREADTLSHLDTMAARADAPEAAKTWITALRLRASGDWRSVAVDSSSPLLLKIMWAQVLADDLTDLGASRKLDGLGQLEVIPDWGRCAVTGATGNPYSSPFSLETGNRYALQTTALEFQELNQVLQIENLPPINPKKLDGAFSSSLQEKLFSGHPSTLHIIGPEMFTDVVRRHLLNHIQATSFWLAHQLGSTAQAEAYRNDIQKDYASTRLLETVSFIKGPMQYEPMDYPEKFAALDRANVRWEPWELPMSKLPNGTDLIYPDFHTLHAFYADGLPYGTAYDLNDRARYSLNNAQLLVDDADPTAFHDPNPNVAHPDGNSLQKLAPNSFHALLLGTPVSEVIQRSKKWWDFNLQPIQWIETATQGFITDEDRAVLMQKHLLLDPGYYFAWGTELRNEGKADEAAVADRKGFDEGLDQVLMADSVGPLIDYYYDQGRKDEAERVARRAAAVGSRSGLHLYQALLEKLGRLDEAERLALAIKDGYDDSTELVALYAAHPEHFGDKSHQVTRQIFPQGMTKVDLASFQGPPVLGCVFTTDSDLLRQGGLQPGDIVVAFDSFKIESMDQYNYIRALSTDSHMHLIIWRSGHYLEMNTSAPERRFQVTLDDYPPKHA